MPSLAEEFHRACVYCMMPDAFGGTFEVEHYRPVSRFKSLEHEYSNLFYACRACNGRKGKRWFEPADGGGYVVNPCQDVMASHVWFERLHVQTRSAAGRLTAEIIQPNDTATVAYREVMQQAVDAIWAKLQDLRRRRRKIESALRAETDVAKHDRLEKARDSLDLVVRKQEEWLRGVIARPGERI